LMLLTGIILVHIWNNKVKSNKLILNETIFV